MNPDVKAKWVKALRSGKYRQTTGGLHDANEDNNGPKMCCLGVLCDVFKQETPDVVWANSEDYTNTWLQLRIGGLDTEATGTLPEEVRRWADLTDEEGSLPREGWQDQDGEYCQPCDTTHPRDQLTSLVALNDRGKGFDFIKIADVIEAYL